MRGLHIYSGNLFGGIEAILLSLVRHRAACADVTHEFALCFEGRLSRELREAGATVHPLPPLRVRRPQTIRQARRALASRLASRAPDVAVLHAPWSHALFAGTVRRASVPLALWAHDAWIGRHWTERWARRTAPDLLVANSRFTAATTAPVFPGVPHEVIYAPVDAPSALSADDRAAVRRELSTPSSSVVIAQASRMEAWKGHAALLRTLAALGDDPRWCAWVIGGAQRPREDTYLASLRQLASDLGIPDRVRFTGERRDVPRLLAAADLYCQRNATPEPFGIVFVEALAAGVPVVTTASGGGAEIVDESCGRLVPADDDDGWREAVGALLEDEALRARLGSNGRRRAAGLCDPARQAARLRDALMSTCRAAVAG